jgi:hypothetical protein
MKARKIFLFSLIACGVIFSLAFAAGDVERGELQKDIFSVCSFLNAAADN